MLQGSLTGQTASKQDTIAEYQTSVRTVPAYLNYKRIGKMDVAEAQTIMARDYKGFGTGNETQNGVIEWERKKK